MRWPCWLVGHTPLLQTTAVWGGPRTIRWVCRHCLKDLGETTVLTWTPREAPPPPRERRA
jgi:hypothetical protein